jgi:Raf kinase inhibitor-like YbhB/YbcL family protein
MHHCLRRLASTASFFSLLASVYAHAAERDLQLVTAAEQQNTAAVRALLKQGADATVARPDGATALHWAAHRNNLEIADLLIRAGANVNAANDHGVTPLALACENGSAPMAERLLNAGANANAAEKSGETVLMTASATGNVEVVKALLAHGAKVGATTSDSGQTALMWAIGERHPDIARVLVEAGAGVRDRSAGGFTPLLFAAREGQIDAARILLAAGVGANETAADGTHPLLVAISSGQIAFARFLLENGGDANAQMRGNTALHAAVTAGLGDFDQRYNSAAQEADGKVDLVKALLASGADVNAAAGATRGRSSVGRSLVEGAFDPYTFGVGSRRYATPFWLAADIGDVDTMKALLAAGADPALSTEDGSTPLMVAAGLGHTGDARQRGWTAARGLEAVKLLLQLGVDVNAANEAGFTALHGTAYPGANDIVKLLVENGADLNAQDFRGRTAYRIAQGHKGSGMIFQIRSSTMELLASLGADTELGVDPTIAERENVRDTAVIAALANVKAAGHPIVLHSTAFQNGETIPTDYTVDGKNISPPLAWRDLPAGTKELVVTCEDPDAATALPFVHWVLYKIPVTAEGLPEGLPVGRIKDGPLAGAVHGLQGFERGGPSYRGPAPPRGAPAHRYVFTVYALDASLDLQIGHNKLTLMDKIKDHIIGIGELTGTYARPLLSQP